MNCLLVTGTDAGVGKTLLITALMSYLQKFYSDRTCATLPALQFGDDLGQLWQGVTTLSQQNDWVFLESFGGLGSPLTFETTVADLAGDWRLPTVLVVPVGANAIAQAVAHVALARQSGIQLKGIVLNCMHPTSEPQISDGVDVDVLRSLTQSPILGYIPYLIDISDSDKLAYATSEMVLENLMPN